MKHYFGGVVAEMASLNIGKALMLLGMTAGLVFAHHGDAGRYEDTLIVLTGTVVDLQLVDPHSIIVFDVTDEKGAQVRWQAELNGKAGLAKAFGWTKNTVKPGDK